MNESIGLIGVGLLGSAILDRLRAAGHGVVALDTDRSRRAVIDAGGAAVAESIGQLASLCPIIILCLPDSQAVQSVADQLVAAAAKNQVIDTTTGDPESTVRIADQLEQSGVAYVDAAVVGSSQQMRQGQAALLVGGSDAVVTRCRPLFQELAADTFHVGPVGSGARMKLVVNLVLGLNRAVMAEGLNLARACGFDLFQTLHILRQSAAYSRVMDVKGEKMIRSDFRPEARLAQHAKDVRLILQLAQAAGAHVPFSEIHRQLLEELVDEGCGMMDNSVIIRAFSP